MNINELSETTGLSREQIRCYETRGLIANQFGSNRKEFDEHDVNRLKKTVLLRKMGFRFSDARLILDDTVLLEEQLAKQLVLLEAEKEKFDGAYNLCKAMLEEIHASDEKVKMEHLDVDRWTAFLRCEETAGHTFVDCWQDIETVGWGCGLLYPFFVKDLRKNKRSQFLEEAGCWFTVFVVWGWLDWFGSGAWALLRYAGAITALLVIPSLPHYLLGKKHPGAVSWVSNGLLIGLLLILFAIVLF